MKAARPDADDWERFFVASPAKYHFSALQAAWDHGGDEMVRAVCQKLKVKSVVELVRLVGKLEKKK